MFTAGNIKWTLGQPRSYLATKGEVLDHFQHCVDVIKQRCSSTSTSAELSDEEADGIVRVTCRSSSWAACVEAKRLIKAYGASHAQRPADFQRASIRCRPTSATFDRATCRRNDAPVWIVGGKTAMDTAR